MIGSKSSRWLPPALALLSASACDWLPHAATPCKQDESKCSGNRVQLCTADLEASVQQGEPTTTWTTKETCSDDPQLGAFTCGLVEGHASCVPKPGVADDAGALSPPVTAAWLRVAIDQSAATPAITQIDRFEQEAVPVKAAAGSFAVVAYSGTDIVDAALVLREASSDTSSVWIDADKVDRVALVAANGDTLSSVQRTPETVSALKSSALMRTVQALDSTLPATLKVRAEFAGAGGDAPPPMQLLLAAALSYVPAELLTVVTEVSLELDLETAMKGFIGSIASNVKADATRTDAAAAASGAVLGGPALPAPSHSSRWPANGGTLVIDFGASAVAEYIKDPRVLALDIIRTLSQAYVAMTDAVYLQQEWSQAKAGFELKLPSDFPAALAAHLADQHASLLQTGETISTAWASLQQVASDAQIANPYGPFASVQTDEQAVLAGFASLRGAGDADSDFADYLAFANVRELWPSSPCSEMTGKALDELAPWMLVHVTKLLALHGLGLLTADALHACAGDLRLKGDATGITLYKPTGESILVTDQVEGIRQPYFGTEIQLSWKAQRSYMAISLGVGYSGTLPTVMRLSAVGADSGQDSKSAHRAVLAITNPDGYQTSVAQGGLVVVTQISPDVLEAFALMVQLDREMAGAKLFPLVAARVLKPVWGAAP